MELEEMRNLLRDTEQVLEATKHRLQQIEHEHHDWIKTHEAEVDQHKQTIAQLQTALKERDVQIGELTSECNAYQTKYQTFSTEHTTLRLRVEELQAALSSKHTEKEVLTQQIHSLKHQQTELINQLHEKVSSHSDSFIHSFINSCVSSHYHNITLLYTDCR
jgi:chromosome segregation ATPase